MNYGQFLQVESPGADSWKLSVKDVCDQALNDLAVEQI